MALFKTFKGLSSTLMSGKPNAVEGYAYFTTDDGKFYIDIATADTAVIGTNRIPLSADFADRIPYAVNNQNASTYNKTITTSDSFTLKEGALIIIKFTAGVPGGETENNNIITFNINDTGQKNVYYRGARIPNEMLVSGKLYIFRYNGTQYDLVGDVIPDLGSNETVITDEYGILRSAPFVDRYEIVQELPTTNIDQNVVYLVSTGESSGGGSGSGSSSSLTYNLIRTPSTSQNITLTASNGTSSSVEALNSTQVQALIDSTITTALSTSYPQL